MPGQYDLLRSLRPDYADASDEEISSALSKLPKSVPYEPDVGDFRRSLQNYGPQFQGLTGAAQAVVGETARRAFGDGPILDGIVDSGLRRMEEAKSRQVHKPTDQFDTAASEGLGTLLTDWLPYQAGNLVGNLGEMAVVSGLGALTGAGVASLPNAIGGAVAKDAVKKQLTKEALAIAARRGATTGQVASVLNSGFGEVGGSAIEEQGVRGMDLNRVIPASLAHSGLEFVGDKVLAGAVKGAGKGVTQIGDVGMKQALIENVAKQGASSFLKEGATELGQTATELWGAEKELNSPEASRQYLNAFMAGGAMGGVAGGVGGVKDTLTSSWTKPSDVAPASRAGAAMGKVASAVSNKFEDLLNKVSNPNAEDPAYMRMNSPVDPNWTNDELVADADARRIAAESLATRLMNNHTANMDERRASAAFLGSQKTDADVAAYNEALQKVDKDRWHIEKHLAGFEAFKRATDSKANAQIPSRKVVGTKEETYWTQGSKGDEKVTVQAPVFEDGPNVSSPNQRLRPLPSRPGVVDGVPSDLGDTRYDEGQAPLQEARLPDSQSQPIKKEGTGKFTPPEQQREHAARVAQAWMQRVGKIAKIFSVFDKRAMKKGELNQQDVGDPQVRTSAQALFDWVVDGMPHFDRASRAVVQQWGEDAPMMIKEAYAYASSEGLTQKNPELIEAAAKKLELIASKGAKRGEALRSLVRGTMRDTVTEKELNALDATLSAYAQGRANDKGAKQLLEHYFGENADDVLSMYEPSSDELLNDAEQAETLDSDEVVENDGEDKEEIESRVAFTGPFTDNEKLSRAYQLRKERNVQAETRIVGAWDKLKEELREDELKAAEDALLTKYGTNVEAMEAAGDTQAREDALKRANTHERYIREAGFDESLPLDRADSTKRFSPKSKGPDTLSNGRLYLERVKQDGEVVKTLVSTYELLSFATQAEQQGEQITQADGARRAADKIMAALSSLLTSKNDFGFTGRIGYKKNEGDAVTWTRGNIPQELKILHRGLMTLNDAGHKSVASQKARNSTKNGVVPASEKVTRADYNDMTEEELAAYLGALYEKLDKAKKEDGYKQYLRDTIAEVEYLLDSDTSADSQSRFTTPSERDGIGPINRDKQGNSLSMEPDPRPLFDPAVGEGVDPRAQEEQNALREGNIEAKKRREGYYDDENASGTGESNQDAGVQTGQPVGDNASKRGQHDATSPQVQPQQSASGKEVGGSKEATLRDQLSAYLPVADKRNPTLAGAIRRAIKEIDAGRTMPSHEGALAAAKKQFGELGAGGTAKNNDQRKADKLIETRSVDLATSDPKDIVWAVLDPSEEADGGALIAAFKDFGTAQTVAEAYGANLENTTVRGLQKVGAGGTASNNLQRAGEAVRPTDAELSAYKQRILDVLGEGVNLEVVPELFKKGVRISADHVDRLIRIAYGAQHKGQSLDHEMTHQLFVWLRDMKAEGIDNLLKNVATNELILGQIRRLLKDDPEALKNLRNPEEAAAYMFQFWKAGLLTLGPKSETLFQKITNALKKFFGLVTEQMRNEQDAEWFMQAFDAGAISKDRDSSIVALEKQLGERRDNYARGIFSKLNDNELLQKTIYSAGSVLRDSNNPALISLAQIIAPAVGEKTGKQGLFSATEQWRTKKLNELGEVLKNVQPEDLPLALEHLNAKTPENRIADPVVRKIVKDVRDYLDKMYDYMQSRNMQRWDDDEKRWKPVPKMGHGDFFPQVWDMEALTADPHGFVELLKEHHMDQLEFIAKQANEEREAGKNAGKFSASKEVKDREITPDDIAQAIATRLMNSSGSGDVQETTSALGITPYAKSVNKRTLKWIDASKFGDYMSKDLVSVLTNYTVQVVKRGEYTSRLGNEGEVIQQKMDEAFVHELEKTDKEAAQKLRKMFEDMSKEHAEARQRGIDYEQPTLIKIAEGKLENFNEIYSKLVNPIKAVMAAEGTLGREIDPNLRKLLSGVTTYQNIRLLPLALFSSFVDPLGMVVNGAKLSDAYEAFTRGVREVVKGWKGEASEDQRAQFAYDLGVADKSVFLDSLGQTYGSMFMSGGMRQLNEQFFKVAGLNSWNRAMRIHAAHAAQGFITRHLNEGSATSKRRLAEIGLDPALKDSYMRNGELDTTNEVVRQAIMQWVDGSILRPNAMQRPILASDPHYLLFYHLKQFAYSFHKTILARVWEEGKHNNWGPGVALVSTYVPMMIAADVIKEVLAPGDDPYWMKKGLGDAVWHGVQRANLMGVPQFGYEVFEGFEPFDRPGRALSGVAGLFGPAPQQLVDWLMVPLTEDKTLGTEALRSLPLAPVATRAATMVD